MNLSRMNVSLAGDCNLASHEVDRYRVPGTTYIGIILLGKRGDYKKGERSDG